MKPTEPNLPWTPLLTTQGAWKAFQEAGENPTLYLLRHRQGDWGEVDEEDWRENDYAAKHNFRILSAYTLKTGVRVWIITEADRSATTFLLPEEY
ncbi:MAG: hypothetical protein C4521_02810 [Actinobacteria bacterium]|nr:MAG: hypothetical protein C4521_02810 [Actinomycetota bacterium]